MRQRFEPGPLISGQHQRDLGASSAHAYLFCRAIRPHRDGYFTYFRDTTLVVDAVRQLWGRSQSCEVLFVGEDYGEDDTGTELKRQIARAGVSSSVRMVGFQRDLTRLYGGSDVMVLPAEDDAFPQTILEAMSMRLPVIAARSGGVPEMIEDGECGVLIEPGDSGCLARALEEVLSDRTRSRRLANKALRRCTEEFSEARHAARVLEVYRRVVRGDADVVV